MRIMAAIMLGVFCVAGRAEQREIPRAELLDKMKGAWAGQMFGVSFGAPWEFRSNGAMLTQDLGPWKPARIKESIGQDDVYVEMTFLKTLEDHGLDVTYEQAGKDFGESGYPLWHANNAGRINIRRGIMPPKSGAPEFNLHADDIDFQIEADLFGILCPGLPQESNRLCDIFGHVMNYGDGVYGGMFVSGMYTAAYFEAHDVEKVIRAGLACIPTASKYHQTITDVLAWHAAHPNDWQTVWNLIEEKYQDDIDCSPGNKFNINANLNGAYIVMGLLYGGGDMMKTAEMAVRCGQDADCNPSNACGVLGCMQGFSKLGDKIVGGIPAMAEIPFDHTAYSFNKLIETCARVSDSIIQRAGGELKGGIVHLPVQEPKAPATLEQWTDKKAMLSIVIPDADIKAWNPGFSLVACGHDTEPGLLAEYRGEKNVLKLHPVNASTPAVVRGQVKVPQGKPKLQLLVASDERGDFELRLIADNEILLKQIVNTKGKWTSVECDLSDYAGDEFMLSIENAANDWSFESAYLGKLEIVQP